MAHKNSARSGCGQQGFARKSFTGVCLAFVALLAACLLPHAVSSAEIVLTGKVVTTVTRAVSLPFHAVVDEVLVKPGAPVVAGTALVRYHLQDDAERALQREVTTGSGTESLCGQILNLEDELRQAEALRNKARHLAASGLGSPQASHRQEGVVKSLRERIALLRNTITKQERNFDLRLEELSAHFGVPLKAGETLPHTLTLKSPIDGYVLSLLPTLNPGSLLPAGSTPISVGQLDPVLIQVPVYEAEISGIKEGDAVEVEIPSLHDKEVQGTVNEISWISTDMNVANPSYYTVEVTVPNPSLELKPGFKAVVRFKNK
ncbi:MAG: efflux RND transporter periplasmic adaptor subunit [Desulfovibrio sp.]|nr:efflux RND transporter periplasmic adaptor subunit [Desulfovibrio sp.]